MGYYVLGKARRIMAAVAAVGMAAGMAACNRTGSGSVPSSTANTEQAVTEEEMAIEGSLADRSDTDIAIEAPAEAKEDELKSQGIGTVNARPELAISYDYWYELNQDSYTECIVSCEYASLAEGEGSASSGLAKSLEDRNEELRAKYRALYDGYVDTLKSQDGSEVQADSDGMADSAALSAEDSQSGTEAREDEAVQGDIFNVSVPYTVYEKLYVRRSDDKVLSILEEETGSRDGEGYTSYDAVSYDVSSGRVLGLGDVVADMDAFQEAIAEACEKQGLSKDAFNAVLKARADLGEELCWTIEPQGLTVWFAAGELDEKANGAHQVSLLFSECAGLLTGQYAASEGKQTTSIPFGSAMVFDVGADGIRDVLTITAQYEEYNHIMEDVVITLGDKSYVEDEIYANSINPYLLVTDTGRSVLYIEYRFDNDYRSLGIYDLNGGEPRLVDMRDDHFLDIFDTDEERIETYPFTNPDGFKLAARLHLLSTVDGYKDAHIGDDGLIVFDSDEYLVARELIITTKQAITVDLIDMESGEVVKKDVEIAEGEPLQLFSSDNQQYVDAVTKDGERVRIYVDTTNDWPLTVNGKDIYDCFDGMIFAG